MSLLPHPPPHAPGWAYFLDLDGTLLEIAATPDAVLIPPRLVPLLEQLAAAGALAIISGRSLSEIDRLLTPLILPAAGLHGFEHRDRTGQRMAIPAEAPAALARIRAAFDRFAAGDPRLIIEDKTISIALHFRRAPERAPTILALAETLRAEVMHSLRLQQGKAVIEFRPQGRDKGDAIAAMMALPPFAGRKPVFLGDDVTDEDGFRVVNRMDGVSIKVGEEPQPTAARYRLGSPAAVLDWLEGGTKP